MRPTLIQDVSLLVARVVIGVIFVAHGWQKHNDKKVANVAEGFRGMDIPLPEVAAYYATYVELIGGALLILGAFTMVVGLLLFIDMIGAFVFAHADKGVFVSEGGWELVAALGVGSLVLAAVGAGAFSVDRILAGATRGRVRGLRTAR